MRCPHCKAEAGDPIPRRCPACDVALGDGPRVVLVRPNGEKVTFPLKARNTIGRAVGTDIQIPDRGVSRLHATIDVRPDGAHLADLGSANGTFVDGRRVNERALNDSDEIRIGESTLRFHLGHATSPGAAVVQTRGTETVIAARAVPSADFRPAEQISNEANLRRDYERLRIAHEFHRTVGVEQDLDKLLGKILDVAFELLPADNGVVLLKESGPSLDVKAVRRREGGSDEVLVSRTLIDRVLETGEGLLSADAAMDARFQAAQSIISRGIRSAMAVPLVASGEVQGALFLDTRHRTNAFTERDLEILSAIASQAALSLENHHLATRIAREAEARAHLARFLSPALVEQAAAGNLELQRGGELREVTILFSDIRSFTAMAEALPAQETVSMLNDYFERMVDVVFAWGGVLDKFMGDGLMALWGAPVRRPDDAARALGAALQMQATAEDFNAERKTRGQPPIAIGVGVATGDVVVGNMGSSKRMEYTAIGDAVNLASRLCGLAQGGHVVATDNTVRIAGEAIVSEPLPAATVKGKAEPVRIHRVTAWRGPADLHNSDSEPTTHLPR